MSSFRRDSTLNCVAIGGEVVRLEIALSIRPRSSAIGVRRVDERTPSRIQPKKVERQEQRARRNGRERCKGLTSDEDSHRLLCQQRENGEETQSDRQKVREALLFECDS
jgi:hypothetical protein